MVVVRLNFHRPQEAAEDHFDEFHEWIDGSVKCRYSLTSRDALSHSSGWAMKYTNNHNKYVLKKTCVGVLACSENCRFADGRKIRIRPAISDRGNRLSLPEPKSSQIVSFDLDSNIL